MKMKTMTMVLLALAGLLLLAGCTAQKGQVTAKGAAEVTQVPMNLKDTAEAIAAGEVDVGEEYGMEDGQRYHTIHQEVLGLKCSSCHVDAYADDYVYQRRYKVPVRDAPGPVDRGLCLGCHKENGVAETKLYGTAGD